MSYIKTWLKEKKITSSDIALGVFFAIVVAIIPLISHYAEVGVTGAEYQTLRASATVNDFFSYNKAFFIKLMGVFIAAFMFFQIISDDGFKINFKLPAVDMMLAFAVLAIASAAFSQYKEVAFGGISERYEGLFVVLCYAVFFIVATGFAANKERSTLLIGALCLSALLVGLIGLTQFFGFDIFATKFGAGMVYGDTEKELAIKFDSVYATLYNPNCASVFFGMMFAFTALPALFIPVKNKLKYIFAVLAVITLICLIGSDSVGGFMGAVCGIAVAGVAATGMMIKKYGKKGVAVAVAAIVVFVAAVAVLLCTDNMIARKVDIITSTLKAGASMESASYYKDFYVEDNKGYVETADGKICIDISGDKPV
jgi:hypothetical protein